MAREVAVSRNFEMSNFPEEAADLQLECPKCGNKPFVMDGTESRKIHSLDDLTGQSCAGCGYVVDESDVESAMKSVIYRLVKDCFGGGS